jgi:hypothetical protein
MSFSEESNQHILNVQIEVKDIAEVPLKYSKGLRLLVKGRSPRSITKFLHRAINQFSPRINTRVFGCV